MVLLAPPAPARRLVKQDLVDALCRLRVELPQQVEVVVIIRRTGPLEVGEQRAYIRRTGGPGELKQKLASEARRLVEADGTVAAAESEVANANRARTVFKGRLEEIESQTKILTQRDVQLAEEIKGHEGRIASAGRQLSLARPQAVAGLPGRAAVTEPGVDDRFRGEERGHRLAPFVQVIKLPAHE